ncbi:MAG: SUMF1/EgtB/PvdO family nonheme iron enzyme [Myxococcales bacterium]|nr:SUMF1/EgtB/PvdO family nonheme iron enzyme [Myxococcales bacterium]
MKARAASPSPLLAELESAREFLFSILPPEEFWLEQPSPSYSPIGWHLGHIAAMQERWLLPGEPSRYGSTFDPVATPKNGRVRLPIARELRAYLDEVLVRVCDGLRAGRMPGVLGLPEMFLVQHIAQHELQHAEHVQVVHALCERRLHRMAPAGAMHAADRLEFRGGRVQVGSDDAARAYDNERPQHVVELKPYWLDPAPVTVGQFAEYLAATKAPAPLGFAEQPPEAPVTCVSWHDADGYARWRGARLPTEHELEAARLPPCGVWEWTSSWLTPYPGFRPYPYEGYSKPWFGTHRVLRGASWATSPDLVRPSLRNWYLPEFRELPSGFRCAGAF